MRKGVRAAWGIGHRHGINKFVKREHLGHRTPRCSCGALSWHCVDCLHHCCSSIARSAPLSPLPPAAPPWPPPDEQSAALLRLPAAALLLSLAAPSLPALAEDSAAAAEGGFDPSTLLVLLPLVLYGIFNLYRQRLNPKASFQDFLFLAGTVVVFGNIISIVVFKVRWF